MTNRCGKLYAIVVITEWLQQGGTKTNNPKTNKQTNPKKPNKQKTPTALLGIFYDECL